MQTSIKIIAYPSKTNIHHKASDWSPWI